MAQQTTLQAIWEAVIHPLWQEQYGSNRSLPELHTMDDYFYCYRKLVNVRPPAPMPDEWIAQQNKVLGAYN
ncbi:protein-ADP-ribose hydrolase, partial [Phytopseudomonas dryadis]